MRVGIERGWFDSLLMMVAAVLALYSSGVSVANQSLAVFLSALAVAAGFVGYGIGGKLEGKPISQWDGWIVAFLGLIALPFTLDLNSLLPDGGFPRQLVIMAWLAAMIILGSLFAWRDATSLFVTLFCIAVFGLVGTFDTFPLATPLFFVFMVLVAVLYARVHQRVMLAQAMRAGVKEPDRLGRGAWRWVAGPEWALASAAVIILISLMGAPLLQFSLRGVSGSIQVALPQGVRSGAARTAPAPTFGGVNVGNGPILLQDETPLFKVRTNAPGYLREVVYWSYTGRGWNSPNFVLGNSARTSEPWEDGGPNGGRVPWSNGLPPEEPLSDATLVELQLEPISAEQGVLYAPGPVTEVLAGPRGVSVNTAGIASIRPSLRPGEQVRYFSKVGSPAAEPGDATLPPALTELSAQYLATGRVSQRVVEFAMGAVQGAESDFDKAMALQRAIERQVRYDLRAPAIPPNADPVEHFLFESREGYCDLFASAMAMSARIVGLPSRYVVGYFVGDVQPDEQGYRTARGKDYHAWAEVYFEGRGWVPFDPTGGAEQVEGAGRGDSLRDGEPFWQAAWFRRSLEVLAFLGLASLVVYAVFAWRRPAGTGVKGVGNPELAKLHARFQRTLEGHVRSPRRFSQTLREYVALSAGSLGPATPNAMAITERIEREMFGGAPEGSGGYKEIGVQIARLRDELKALRKAPA